MVAKMISLIALAATIVPSLLYLTSTLDHEPVKWISLVGTFGWFIATPLWMGRENQVVEHQEVVP